MRTVVRVPSKNAGQAQLRRENRLRIRRKNPTHGGGQGSEGVYLAGSGVTGGALNDLEARVNGAQTIAIGLAKVKVPSAKGNTETRKGRV